jgi:DNA-directed RNA polymerase specialized sigma24 family protein
LATLNPEDAAVLTMFYLDELSVEEIVTATGLGASNVKVKLHRGRRKLGEALQRTLGPEARALLFDHA